MGEWVGVLGGFFFITPQSTPLSLNESVEGTPTLVRGQGCLDVTTLNTGTTSDNTSACAWENGDEKFSFVSSRRAESVPIPSRDRPRISTENRGVWWDLPESQVVSRPGSRPASGRR